MPAISLDTDEIDWDSLRVAKIHIVARFWPDAARQNHPVWGLIALLDDIQDRAVDAGVPERDVFGPEPPDVGPPLEDDE